MRIPYPEVTGLICRIPLTGLPQHTLGFSPWGTCVGSQYEHKESLSAAFLRTPGISRTRHKRRAHDALPCFSTLHVSTGLVRVDGPTGPHGLPGCVSSKACVAACISVVQEY